MTILRRRHNSNFTIVPNAIFEHPTLSAEAKCVLGFLLSRPPDWTIRLAHIGPVLRIGRDKLERIFRELTGAGFVLRGKQSRPGGKWGSHEFEVWDEPNLAKGRSLDASAALPDEHDTAAAPCPEKQGTAPCPEKQGTAPCPEKPCPENQGTYKGLKDNKTAAADASAREQSKSLITPEAFTLSADLMRLQRLEEDDPRCIGQAYAAQSWLSKGWDADVIRSTIEIVMARRTEAPNALRYFESAIEGWAGSRHASPNYRLPR